MKSLLLTLAAATLVSTTAMAEQTSTNAHGIRVFSNNVTGVVHVNQPMCIVAPCPAFVSIEKDGKSIAIPRGSKIADDLAAFAGKTVTVLGNMSATGLDPQAFMPGKSADFLTGTLHTRCMNGASTCRAFIEVDGKQFMIKDEFKKYAGLDGATVTIPGELRSNCPANAKCIIEFSEFIPKGDSIMVKGNLGMLMRNVHNPMIPHPGNYLLTLDGGKTVVVDAGSHNWMDRNDSTVWLRGHMNAGGGDLAPYFTATSASKPVYDNSSPIYANNGEGNNAGRNDSTNPSSGTPTASNGGSGAGVKR